MQEPFSLLHRSDQLFDDKVDLEQPESDRVDVVAAALEGGAIERYLDQMEAGNTQVSCYDKS